ncbi:MAG: hypothetical protein HKN41_11485, partial [Ilumatobacter sp.]|nr:hypothetical protein [Ilumatobacter sp.]
MTRTRARTTGAVAMAVLLAVSLFAGPATAAKGGGKGKPPKKTTTTVAATTTTSAPSTTTTTTTTIPSTTTTTTTTTSTTTTTTSTTTTTVPTGPSWIVTLGDSAISGESGRWAGNTTSLSPAAHDTGADAYFDNASNTAETIQGCHRSKAAEAHIGGGVSSLNLACSGARTYTQTGGDFKPGLDWYVGPEGTSQVVALEAFAASNDVDAVTVLIGANNFGFADIVQTCVSNWLLSPWWWKNYCHDDSSISSRFTASAVEARTVEVQGAIENVAQAMENAGYTSGDYTLIIQTYWSPIPRGADIRYPESGYTRQSTGGCGFWNRDADWANDTAVVKMNQALTDGIARTGFENYVILDMSESMNGHRLCETGVGLLEEVGLTSWTQPGAADDTEWVNHIRTLSTLFGPYQVQESIHSSYW